MEMRAREDVKIGEDLTPPLPPLASALYSSTLSSHCSACFSPLPSSHFTPTFSNYSSHVLYYCSPLCSSLDSPLHFSSAESHLLHQLPPSTCPDSSDLRLSLRLLSVLQSHTVPTENENSYDGGVLERIGGLMTNRERLLVIGGGSLSKCEDDCDDDDVGGELVESVRNGAKVMTVARRMERGGSGDGEENEDLCTAVLCLVMTNAVEVQDESGRGIGVAVYDTTFSWINHSCTPNACYRFSTSLENGGASRLRICPAVVGGGVEVLDNRERGLISKGDGGYGPRIMVWSIKAIRKGEEVTITYTDLIQPKAMRQAELWSKYRFDCFCKRCSSIPPSNVDLYLQEMVAIDLDSPSSASDHDSHSREMIRILRECYDDAITEYMSCNNPKSCCHKLENLLIEGQIVERPGPKKTKSRSRILLHPFHHLSLNAYMILASAYKVRANDLLGLSSENETYQTEAFNLMKISAAYYLILAGATHHLFSSEASLIVSVANFWISAGESLLTFARNWIWKMPLNGPTDTRLPSLSNYKCDKCSLLYGFSTASFQNPEQDMQFEKTLSTYLGCITEITSKLWTFLVNGESYLKVIKDPIEFSWLTTIEPSMMFNSGTRHINTGMEYPASKPEAKESNDEVRMDLLQLGVHCLLYGAFLSSICYGQKSYLICKARDILKLEGVLI